MAPEKDLAVKVRRPTEKADFQPRVAAIHGTYTWHNLSVTCSDGTEEITLVGYYAQHALEIQNERQLARSTCLAYDSTIWKLVAPPFGTYALSTMEEVDFIAAWELVEMSCTSENQLREAYAIVRIVAKHAYDHDATSVLLEHLMPEEYSIYKRRKKPSNDPKKLADRLAAQGIRIRSTMDLRTEVKLILRLLQLIDTHGEALGALIMDYTGVRTGETLGFSYKQLQQHHSGCWVLIRVDRMTSSGVQEEGGKSDNAIRYLYIPQFLAKILLDRKKRLEELFSPEEVADMPIVCYGIDYNRAVRFHEFNSFVKKIFAEVGVAQSVLESAIEAIRSSPESMAEYEKSVVSYLLRHQALTYMVACGLSEAQITYCAGHAQIDLYTSAYDFSNPDFFKDLVAALNRRPTVQIFDQLLDYETLSFAGGQKAFLTDGWTQITFDTDEPVNFLLQLKSREINQTLKIADSSGIHIYMQENTPWIKEEDLTRKISIRPYLKRAGELAYAEALKDFAPPPVEDAADDLDWIDELASEEAHVVPISEPAALPLPDIQDLVPVHPPKKLPKKPPHTQKNPQAMPVGSSIISISRDTGIYVVDQDGRLITAEDEHKKVLNRGAKGRRVTPPKIGVTGLYTYLSGTPAWGITRDARIIRIPEGICLDDPLHTTLMCTGGLLLTENDIRAGYTLIGLTATGDIACLDANLLLGSFPVSGQPLICYDEGNPVSLVSACICPPDTDVLLVTQHGYVLRLSRDDLNARKSFSITPVRGIRLEDGDHAVACMPCTERGILTVTHHGHAHFFDNVSALHSHGRGSGGVALVKLRDGDRVVASMTPTHVMTLLRQDGYLSCVDCAQIPAKGRNAIGVTVMKTSWGAGVIAASPIPHTP